MRLLVPSIVSPNKAKEKRKGEELKHADGIYLYQAQQ
jgi:hypothetical protein